MASRSCGTFITLGAQHGPVLMYQGPRFVQVRLCFPPVCPRSMEASPHLNALASQDLTFEELQPGASLEHIVPVGIRLVFSPAPFPSNFQPTKHVTDFGSELGWARAPSPRHFLAKWPLRSWPQSMRPYSVPERTQHSTEKE